MDWDLALSAMRSSDPEAVAEALAMLRGEHPEAHETHDPPHPLIEQHEDNEDDAPDDGTGRCWLDDEEGIWMTNFPPLDGFTGYQQGQWGDAGYQRECSPEERALLDRGDANDLAYYRAGDAALRDSWFARVEAQLAAQSGGEPIADPSQ
jgi:hypothetical protein